MMSISNTALLRAAGFAVHREEVVLVYGNEEADRVIAFDAETMGPVTDETTSFLVKLPRVPEAENAVDVILPTSDVRDVVALGISAVNSHRFGVHGEPVPETHGFVHEGDFVHNPFADEWGDWGGTPVPFPGGNKGIACKLTHATELDWAAEYLTWRDEFCANLLNPSNAPSI